MNAKLSQITTAAARLAGLTSSTDDTEVFETAARAPRRPTLGAALLLTAPIGSAVLLQGIRGELTEAISAGSAERALGLLAVVILVAQCTLSVHAGLLALRGDTRGTDLSALAMLAALTACVVLFLAGGRLDYLGWALALIATQAAGMFHLDTDTANAWYLTRRQVTQQPATHQPATRQQSVLAA